MHTTRRSLKLLLLAALAALLGAAVGGPAFAGEQNQVIPLSSGVDEGGACSQVSGSGINQTWEFNVDDLYGDTSTARLFAEFSDGTSVDGVAPTTADGEANQAAWLVTTEAGATLVSASADVTDANPDGAELIVVGCTLSGDPTTTTVAPTTVAPTTVPVVPAEVTTTAAAVAVAAELPRTGSMSPMAAAIGFVLLAAGLSILISSRRTAKTD
jgi:LPXTG-motif cell wall-anchored protein